MSRLTKQGTLRKRAEEELKKKTKGTVLPEIDLNKLVHELRKSEEKYRTLLQEINEGFCLIEVIFDDHKKAINLRFLEASPGFEHQSGLKNVNGKLITDLMPDLEERWLEIYGRIAQTGVAEHFEEEAKALGRYFEVRAYPHGNPEDHLLAILFNDISRRKQAEETLKRSEGRLRALITATSDVFYRMSPDWGEMYSQEGGNFLDSVEKPEDNWLKHFIPVNTQPKVLAAIQEAIRTKSMFELEHEVFRADGSVGWTLSKAIPLMNDKKEIVEWIGIASDFTDRVNAENAIRENQEKLRSLLSEMNRGFCLVELIYDENGKVIDYLFHEHNREFENIIGLSEIKGKRRSDLGIPMDYQIIQIYAGVEKTGIPVHFEWLTGGRYYDINAYRSGKQGTWKVAVVLSDITERKKTEIELLQSEERFSKAFHNLAIPASIMREADNILIDVNLNFLELFQYSAPEVIGHTSKELHLFVDYSERMKTVDIMNETGQLRNFEMEMLKKDGTKLTLLVSSQPVIIHEQRHFLTSYFDITERKAYERKLGHLSSIIQYSGEAIISKDLEGNILTWNKGAEKIFGYTEEEIVGKNISVLDIHGKNTNYKDRVKRILNNEIVENFETKRRRKDGTVIPVIVNLSPLRTASGDILAISSIMHDISDRKKAEETLRAKHRAEEADKMKTNFLLTMSHELRTPLNSIIGFSGILLKQLAGPLNPEQEKQIEMVQKSGKHLLSMINDLLDIIKIEEGQIKPDHEVFNLQEAIEDVQKIMQPFADSKGIAIDFIKEPAMGVIVSDKKRFSQIMINLLNNAVKFTEKGTVTITCCRDDHTIYTEILDTGIGIRKEDMEKLFTPFMQLENNPARKYQGTGLGLSITKKLVEILDGSIRVKSEFGVGSSFTFSLPVISPAV